MSTYRTIAGSAVPTFTTIALSTVAAQLVAASLGGSTQAPQRRAVCLFSSGSFALVGSSTRVSSTEGALIPANANPQFFAPAITNGAIWGITTAGASGSVGVVVF